MDGFMIGIGAVVDEEGKYFGTFYLPDNEILSLDYGHDTMEEAKAAARAVLREMEQTGRYTAVHIPSVSKEVH